MIQSSIKTAVRRLRSSPRLTVASVACIAAGTAATSAAFTLVSAALLRPLPYPEADRLVRIWLQETRGEPRISLSYPDLQDLEDHLSAPGSTVEALEATARSRVVFLRADGARRVEGEAVTPGYFELLGVEPLVGRLFTDDEYEPGGERVMLLEFRTWAERFGGDEGVVGRTIRTDFGQHTVVGVLPPSFTGTVEDDSGELEFWVPMEQYMDAERRESRDRGGIWTIGRLAPGATIASAGDAVEALGRRLAELYPDTLQGDGLMVERVGEKWRSGVRRGALLLLGAAVLLLLVAAANVAILLIARAIDDRREMAVRAALGAGRHRMVGQVLIETLLVVAIGSSIGLWLGPLLLRTIVSVEILDELDVPVSVGFTVDPVAAGLACLAFLTASLLAALGPTVVFSGLAPGEVLQEGGRSTIGGRRTRRWRNAVILAEVAVTMVLVVGAALLARSYRAMQAEDLGFRTQDVLRIALFVNEEEVADDGHLFPFYERLRSELDDEPGVERTAVVWPTLPTSWPMAQVPLLAPGLEPSDPERSDEGVRVGLYVTDRAFFDVLEIPLLAGRSFRTTDGPDGAAVALVSHSLALRLAGAEGAAGPGALARALGTEATLGGEAVRIVGVVADARFGGPREAESPATRFEVYRPFAQSPRRLMALMIATAGSPEALVPPLSRRLAELAPASAQDWVSSLDQSVSENYMLEDRLLLSVIGLFALAGLVLSAAGLFAVLADSVARRRPELGLRQALGATPGAVLASVFFHALRLVFVGLAFGAALSWVAVRVLESILYGVPATDLGAFLTAALVLIATAVVASLLPALRAAAVPPAEVLRHG